MKLRSVDVNFVPSIMADENQALNVDENSTIDDIRHGLSTTDCFGSFKESKLTKNHRNTKIAAFAEKFYVGNQTEKADSSQCDLELSLNFFGTEVIKTIGLLKES